MHALQKSTAEFTICKPLSYHHPIPKANKTPLNEAIANSRSHHEDPLIIIQSADKTHQQPRIPVIIPGLDLDLIAVDLVDVLGGGERVDDRLDTGVPCRRRRRGARLPRLLGLEVQLVLEDALGALEPQGLLGALEVLPRAAVVLEVLGGTLRVGARRPDNVVVARRARARPVVLDGQDLCWTMAELHGRVKCCRCVGECLMGDEKIVEVCYVTWCGYFNEL